MSKVEQQETLTMLVVEKEIFTKEKFLEMVSVIGKEIKRSKGE